LFRGKKEEQTTSRKDTGTVQKATGRRQKEGGERQKERSRGEKVRGRKISTDRRHRNNGRAPTYTNRIKVTFFENHAERMPLGWGKEIASLVQDACSQ
jgi:hypothetical protein